MREYWDRFGWLFATAVLVLAITTLYFGPRELWCSSTSEHCFREWVGASSGWAAAAAAVFTIRVLFEQVQTQRQQTGFMLGDALPTFDAVQHTRTDSVAVLKIINWNRRACAIRAFRISKGGVVPDQFEVWQYIKGQPENFRAGFNSGSYEFAPRILILGWIDRQKRPAIVEFRFRGSFAFEGDASTDWSDVEITVEYEMVGTRKPSSQVVSVMMTSSQIV